MEELTERLGELMSLDIYNDLIRKPEEYLIVFEKRFDLSDLDISSRVLNHWKDYGLLPGEEVKEDAENETLGANNDQIPRKRNKFNFFELIYLHILQDLRKFGFPLNKMKKVKEALLFSPNFLEALKEISENDIQDMKKVGIDVRPLKEFFLHKHEIVQNADLIPKEIKEAPLLSYAILGVIISKIDLKLVITEDAQVSLELTNSVGQVGKTYYNSQPHITLPLYNYLYHFLSNKKYKEFYVMYKLLNDQELLILDHVRNGLYKEIKVIMSKGDTIRMELTKELKTENAERLQEILLKGEFQELNIKTEHGKISYSTLKTKEKL